MRIWSAYKITKHIGTNFKIKIKNVLKTTINYGSFNFCGFFFRRERLKMFLSNDTLRGGWAIDFFSSE